jgi:hypothetical protein
MKINLTKELAREILDAAYVCYMLGAGIGHEWRCLIQNIHALYPGMLKEVDCEVMAHLTTEADDA